MPNQFLSLLLRAVAGSPEDPYRVVLEDRFVISVIRHPDGRIVGSLVDTTARTELVATLTGDQLEVTTR